MKLRWDTRLVVIAVIALVAGLAVVDRYHVGVFHDDSMYVVLARSLATGQGYRYLNVPGEPVASHFPPAYPMVLSLLWRLMPSFPANVIVFKLLNVLMFTAAAVLVTQLAQERLGSRISATALGIVCAISVPSLVLVSMVLSEPMFLALVLFVLLLAERMATGPDNTRRAMVIGLLIGIATLVRAHGIVLIPAALLPLLAQRRWRESGLLLAAAMLCIAPWQLWSTAHSSVVPAPLAGNYGSYAAWWLRGYRSMGASMIPATLERTITEAGATFSALFSPRRGEHSHLVTRYGLLLISLAGAVVLAARAPVTLVFLTLYSAIVAIWPFPPSRFAWGVWPLVLFAIVAGMHSIVALDWTRLRWLRYGLAAIALWLGAGYAEYEWRAIRGAWWGSISRGADPRIAAAVDWTLRHTRPGDVVASDDEGAIYLYTGRKAVPVASFTTAHYLTDRSPETEAMDGLAPILAAYPVSVVLVGSPRTFAAAQYLASGPAPSLVLRDQFADGAAFNVLRR